MEDYLKGKRIRLVEMHADPDPIPVGLCGTVLWSTPVPLGRRQVIVKWDDERTLALCVPPDKFDIIDNPVVTLRRGITKPR